MAMAQVRDGHAGHEHVVEPGRDRRLERRRRRRARRCAARPRPRKQALLEPRGDAARRSGREPDRRRRASSRAAARPSTTATLIGGKLFNTTIAPAAGIKQGDAPSSAEPVQGRRQRAPAHRHPGQGQRHVRPTSRTSACRGCCTAASSARAARPRTAPARRRSASTSVDQAHQGRAGRPQGRLPRRRRAEGVRRDPGGRAAQGEVGRADREAPGNGNLQAAALDDRRTRVDASRRQPATSRRLRRRREGAVRELPVATMAHRARSARTRAIADVKADSATVLCMRRRTPTRLRDRIAVDARAAGQQVRVQFYPGSSNYGHVAYDDAAHRGGDPVAGRRQAGARCSSCAGTSTAGTIRPGRS